MGLYAAKSWWKSCNTRITPTIKYGGSSVIVVVVVVDAFTTHNVGDLHQMKGKLNQTSYHSILQHHVIPSGTWLVTQGFVLMQDNDPKPTSKPCQWYIKRKEEQHVLQWMSWMVPLADLNPIELVWDKLDRKVRC